MSSDAAFQRAYSAEHKAQRAHDLADAARTLAARDGVRAVTLASIAQHAGVHASAVRRYYASREEILLLLAQEGYEDWSEAAVARLAQYDSLSPADVARTLVDTLGERPLFCDLLTHVTLSLEHESGYERVRAFKAAASRALNIVSDTIAARSALERIVAEELVIAALALAGPLWQASHPAENVQRLYREEPELAHVAIDFEHTLARLVAALGGGLISDQRAQEDAEQRA
ncbi:TetR family transcriptional regulator [Streptomyces sp. NPDC058678]|uniref:TetR family transcriptional regulator n=1 Tax=Streptomyces sp. NPDC058678 TaxID=3346595 RepID=UPI00364D7AA4